MDLSLGLLQYGIELVECYREGKGQGIKFEEKFEEKCLTKDPEVWWIQFTTRRVQRQEVRHNSLRELRSPPSSYVQRTTLKYS